MPHSPGKYNRRSIRWKEYDYATAGGYFATICTEDMESLLGSIVHGIMELNLLGKLVQLCWNDLTFRYNSSELDAFIVQSLALGFGQGKS